MAKVATYDDAGNLVWSDDPTLDELPTARVTVRPQGNFDYSSAPLGPNIQLPVEGYYGADNSYQTDNQPSQQLKDYVAQLPVEMPKQLIDNPNNGIAAGVLTAPFDVMSGVKNVLTDPMRTARAIEHLGVVRDPTLTEGERFQTFPEVMVRSGLSAPKEAYQGEFGITPEVPGQWSERDQERLNQAQEDAIFRAQDVAGMAGGASFGTAAVKGIEPNALGVVPVPRAKALNIPSAVPSDILKTAAENTPGASIDADGHLIVNVGRKQLHEQEGAESVRGGVFYLPAGDRNFRHYGTAQSYYGGGQKIEGETAYKNPLVVKGATGGKAPEEAYKRLVGKETYDNMQAAVKDAIGSYYLNKNDKVFLVQRFLEAYAPELKDYADYILDHSSKGNQLKYALQEAAIASAVRKAGHDGIIGYSLKRDGKSTPFISEIFDVRENRYPSPSGDYSVHESLLSDTSKPGMALSALERAPTFYSAVEHAVQNAKQNVAITEQWLGYLKNQPGVKQEELDWVLSGLPEGKITKKQLEEHVAANKVQLKEVNKGEVRIEQNPKEVYDSLYKSQNNGIEWQQLNQRERQHWVEIFNEQNKSPTKFSQWQLPGGDNYKEMLLQLPENNIIRKQIRELEIRRNEIDSKADQINYRNLTKNEKDEYVKINEELSTLHQQELANKPFVGSHWSEPNVLAHIRMNDRNIPDPTGNGNSLKSLHIEEIQSDWHQKGRKEGYIGDRTKLNKLQAIDDKLLKDEEVSGHPDIDTSLKMAVDRKLITPEEAKFYKDNSKIDHPGAVPDAPFKQSWPDLTLKRMIRYASENGYDAISWTPGEAQAARYDLSKHINDIQVSPRTDARTGEKTRSLLVSMPNGKVMSMGVNKEGIVDNVGASNLEMKGKKLDEILGKEMAEKIMNVEGSKKFEGLDLKIGGEGMKAFYDKMLVDKANALAKKFGGKVETRIPEVKHASVEEIRKLGKTLYETYDRKGGEPLFEELSDRMKQFYYDKAREKSFLVDNQIPAMHILRLPQSLKDTALHKGFPLFADSGKVGAPLSALERVHLKPLDHNPFTMETYHGSPHPFKGSEIRTAPLNEFDIDPKYSEFYHTPNSKLAEGYTKLNPEKGFRPNVMPLKTDVRDYHTVDAKGKTWDAVNQFAINEAHLLNKKGVILHNVLDDAKKSNSVGPQTVVITLDPSTVRSKFAKFDPKDFGKSGLMLSDTQKAGAPLSALEKQVLNKEPVIAKDHVRLYRGENSHNEPNGGYYTTDKELASSFGKLRYVDLPKNDAKFFKMPGMKDIYNLNDYKSGPSNANWRLRSDYLASGFPIITNKNGDQLDPKTLQPLKDHLVNPDNDKAKQPLPTHKDDIPDKTLAKNKTLLALAAIKALGYGAWAARPALGPGLWAASFAAGGASNATPLKQRREGRPLANYKLIPVDHDPFK